MSCCRNASLTRVWVGSRSILVAFFSGMLTIELSKPLRLYSLTRSSNGVRSIALGHAWLLSIANSGRGRTTNEAASGHFADGWFFDVARNGDEA